MNIDADTNDIQPTWNNGGDPFKPPDNDGGWCLVGVQADPSSEGSEEGLWCIWSRPKDAAYPRRPAGD